MVFQSSGSTRFKPIYLVELTSRFGYCRFYIILQVIVGERLQRHWKTNEKLNCKEALPNVYFIGRMHWKTIVASLFLLDIEYL